MSPPQASDREVHPKQALALHDEAWVLYEQGRYRAAIDRLEAALRIDPEGRELVYNLALLHEKLADLAPAITYYRRYLEMESDPKTKARIQATLRRLEGAEREAARVTLAPRPAPPPLAPRAPPPRRLRPWVVAMASVSGAALVVGVGSGVRALLGNPGSSGRTGPGVTIADLQADAHAAHTAAMVADTSFAISAVAASAALILFFAQPRAVAAAAPSGSTMGLYPPSPSAGARVAATVAAMGYVGAGPGLVRVAF
jgi:tetratricopeptide (TPR) repeat protein